MARSRDEVRQQERQQREQAKPNGHAAKATPRFKLLGLDDLDDRPDDDWLIEGMLPRQGVGVLYGRWKSFKSFVALDVAWALADQARRSWAGAPIKRHGTVIYIVCEGQTGMRKRLLAYKVNQGDNELPSLYRIEQRPLLGQPRSIDVIELVNAIKAGLPENEVVLVIIDTLARTLGGFDENNEGMRNFLDNAEDLAERLACLVLAVHHEGAAGADRPRGGTTLPAGIVVQWRVKRERAKGLRCQLVIEEAKDSVSDEAFDINLRRHEFGKEGDERRESTLIVDTIEKATPSGGGDEDEPTKRKRKRTPPTLGAFMDSVQQALHDQGIEQHVRGPGGSRVKMVAEDFAMAIYRRKRGEKLKPESADRTFRRHKADAIDRNLVAADTLADTNFIWMLH